MQKHLLIHLLIAIVLVVTYQPARADYRIVVGESGIYCHSENGKIIGVMCDLAQEMMKRMGYATKMQIVPHRRLKAMMKMKAAETFYIPSSRNGSNNNDLQYVVEMLEDDYVVVTSTKFNADSSTIQSTAKFQYVCILGGSEAEILAKQILPNIDSTSSQEECAKKLDFGRTEGWVSTWNGARYTAKSIGLDPNTLKRGAKVMDAHLVVVATPDVPKAEIEKWQAAFESLKVDGTVNRVFRQYDVQLKSGD